MRAVGIGIPLFAFTLVGCASSAPQIEDLPRVPVYQVGEETPCEYEQLGRVVAEQRNTGTTDGAYRDAMQQALGRAGAKAGADAVIVRDFVRRLPFAVRGADPPRAPRMFEGISVRWIEEPCKS